LRFQWLKDYQELEEQILYIKWNLNKSKLELNRWIYGDLSEIKIEKNSRSSSLENNIEKMLEEIVKLKYVDNMTLEEIAEETGYSPSYIRKKHSDVRNTLKFVDEYEARSNERQKKISEIEYYDENRTKDNQITLF
jgi:AraC-like DNA-binding protein